MGQTCSQGVFTVSFCSNRGVFSAVLMSCSMLAFAAAVFVRLVLQLPLHNAMPSRPHLVCRWFE